MIFNRETARYLRAAGPQHTPPTAQPLNSTVELTVRSTAKVPVAIVHDRRRAVTWEVALTPQGDDSWCASLRMPSVPTVLTYHFRLEDGSTLFDLRQVDTRAGSNDPVYGQWQWRPFQIAVYDPDAAVPEWTHGQVIYQIFPDRFARSADSDPVEEPPRTVYGQPALYKAWDDTPEHPPQSRDFYGGTLRGIIARLDYLRELGVECLYVCPIVQAPSNHRYDAIDFFKVDPLLGDIDDLRRLVEETHARGMRFILDGVFNHCSSDSLYFNASGEHGDDRGAAQTIHAPEYRWFEFKDWPRQYRCWVDFEHMPELVECPEVEDFVMGPQGVSNHWLACGLDGWRTDVTPWKSEEFWRRFRRSVRATNPDACLIAEEWHDASHYLVGDTFDATMNYRFQRAALGFFALDALLPSELIERLETLTRETPAPVQHAQVNLIGSHDTARAMSVCMGNRARFKQLAAFQLAYPGAPMVYYGDEAGLDGEYAEAGRKGFPWQSVDAKLHSFYRKALHIRRESPALRHGETRFLPQNDVSGVLIMLREHPAQVICTVFNRADNEATINLPDTEEGWLTVFGEGVTIDGHQITLAGRGFGWLCGADLR